MGAAGGFASLIHRTDLCIDLMIQLQRLCRHVRSWFAAEDLQSIGGQQHSIRRTALALGSAASRRPRSVIAERRLHTISLIGRPALLGLTCILLLAPSTALALIGGELDRDARYAAVVTIISEAGSRKHCSATKIGERRFLTAAHCVLDMDSGRLNSTHQRGGSLEISNVVSPKSMADFIAVQVRETHIHPDFRAGVEELLASRAERIARLKEKYEGAQLVWHVTRLKAKHVLTTRFPDVAVIEVDRLTPTIATAELDLESSLEDATVTLVGYGCQSLKAWRQRSEDSTFGERRWADTRVLRVDAINFYSSARRMHADGPSLCPGDSGGAVMYRGKVVGVHGAAFGPDSAGRARSNMAVNLSELRRWQQLSERP
jgi:hypothetical protein